MSLTQINKKVEIINKVENNKEEARINPGTARPGKKKWKIAAGCITGALFLTVAVVAIINLSVLKFVFLPENIVISERGESIVALRQLENSGDVKNLEVSSSAGVSFSNADESIKVTSEYDGERFRSVSGKIDAGRVNVSTMDEGKELARVMLSPYLGEDEIRAILVRYSPDIISGISGAASDNINMSFDIGNNYRVTVTGSAYDTIGFEIVVKR